MQVTIEEFHLLSKKYFLELRKGAEKFQFKVDKLVSQCSSLLTVEHIMDLALNIQIENDAPAFFRLGLNSKHGSFSPHPSFGFGYNIPMKNKLNLGIDYAIDLGMVDEGISHLFTLTFSKK